MGDFSSEVCFAKNTTENFDAGKLQPLDTNLGMHHASLSFSLSFKLAEDN